VTSGEENSIVRDIENINVSRTLNFVFLDLRIGFFKVDMINGVEKHTYTEVTPFEVERGGKTASYWAGFCSRLY
jgi:hypothetical protein